MAHLYNACMLLVNTKKIFNIYCDRMYQIRMHLRELSAGNMHQLYNFPGEHAPIPLASGVLQYQRRYDYRAPGSTSPPLNLSFFVAFAVADPEGDPRVPWTPPFRLNIACKNRTPSNLQRSNSLSQLALLSCLYSLATKLKIIIRKLEPSSLVHAAAG